MAGDCASSRWLKGMIFLWTLGSRGSKITSMLTWDQTDISLARVLGWFQTPSMDCRETHKR